MDKRLTKKQNQTKKLRKCADTVSCNQHSLLSCACHQSQSLKQKWSSRSFVPLYIPKKGEEVTKRSYTSLAVKPNGTSTTMGMLFRALGAISTCKWSCFLLLNVTVKKKTKKQKRNSFCSQTKTGVKKGLF